MTSKEIRRRINLNGAASNYTLCVTYIPTINSTISRAHFQTIVDSFIHGKVVVM